MLREDAALVPSVRRDASYTSRLLPNPDRCEHCRALRHDTNVLVLQRLSELSTLSAVNLTLAILCVMYLGSTMVCLIYTLVPVVKGSVFHRLEFGGMFLFTLCTTLALIFSPERRFRSKLLLKVLVLVNVCASFVAGLLVFLSLDEFERVAHEIEYANELCTAVVDVLIVLTLELKGDERQQCWQRSKLIVIGTLATAVPVLQLVVYNSEWGGEDRARYVEFVFNAVSAGISFWFCTDSMFIANRLKLEIMLAPTDLTVVIDSQSRRAVHDHGDKSTYAPPSVGPAPPACGGCDDCADCGAGEAATGLRVTKGLLATKPQPLSPQPTASQTGGLLTTQLCEPCELPPSLG